MRLLLAVLIGAISLGWSTVAPAQTFLLSTNVAVDSEGVFLAQVLVPQEVTPVPVVRLADAPPFGRALTLTRAQLLERLQKENLGFSIGGANTVQVTRRAKAFGEVELKELLTTTLQNGYVKDRGEVELRMLRVWHPVLLPDEPLTLKVLELPNAGVSSSFIVRFQLSTTREVLGTWQMPLQAKIWREVWVAKSSLRSGQQLADADLGRERRDVLGLRDLLPEEPQENLELVESVSAGTPLTSRSVRPKPVVHRGQMVDAQVQDGTLLISLRVEVLENGAPGQNIRVRNVQSRREFRGKVINEQTILVSL